MRLHEDKEIRINIAGIESVKICEELGEGGQGHVWKVKPISAKYANYYVLKHIRLTREEKKLGYDERIRREAGVTVDSPHVIKCLGYSEPERDDIVLLFPFEPGQNLAEWIDANAQAAWPLKKRIFLDILEGVRALHRAHILHRDLKPQNILVTEHYLTPRLIDFGLAKFRDLDGLTMSGQKFGTLAYMAPEMLVYGAKEVNERYDVYALGMILHELIAGQNAWLAHQWNIGAFVNLVRQEKHRHLLDIAPLRFTEDAAALEAIRRGTMFEPTERMASVDAMIAVLSGHGDGPKVGDSWTEPTTGMVFMWIPAGRFMMGSPNSEEGRFSDESPVHEVRFAQGFWMGKYPVTQAEWQTIMGNNPSRFTGANRPVEQVSWNDAQAFLKNFRSLGDFGNLTPRLPSEAEWEYACRAGTTTPFYFGDTISADQANYDGNYTYGKGKKGVYREQTTDVGSFPPNAFGLCDMHGNVWEWCADTWHENYDGAPSDGSIWGNLGDGKAKLLRGGSWYGNPNHCRSAGRYWYVPDIGCHNLGARVVVGAR